MCSDIVPLASQIVGAVCLTICFCFCFWVTQRYN